MSSKSQKRNISTDPNPPTVDIPPNKIACVAYNNKHHDVNILNQLYTPLRNKIKRDWFIKHAYNCLPLVMANQHGFVLNSLYDFTVEWNGGDAQEDVKITFKDENEHRKHAEIQRIEPHFGMGTFTIQTCYTLRTPKGVNLMTFNPPNLFIDGLCCMTAVIETDNLRRDFTFNTRVTTSDSIVRVSKGDPLGCIIPYPRHFIDKYEMVVATDCLTDEQIRNEQRCATDHGIERSDYDINNKGANGHRYRNGEDVYGQKFEDHQTKLNNLNSAKCPFFKKD